MRQVHRTASAPPDLGTEVIGVRVGTQVELDLQLEAVMEGVLVSGTARTTAAGDCVRCLDALERSLEVTFQELFVYPGKTPMGSADEDLHELEGDLLDLEPMVRDAVVLALPFQPVCSPGCPGLCSECGVRLADDPGHQHDSTDPRWAALQTLVDDHRDQKES